MRVTLFMDISLNGMIARPDDRADFFTDICWYGFVDIVREGGAIIIGRTTHDLVRDWPSFRTDLVGTPTRGVVLTTKPDYTVGPSWEIAVSPKAALEQLRARGIEHVVVAGGTAVNTAFIRKGLVDALVLFVEAVIIGEGLPLIESAPLDVSCRLVDVRRLTDTVARLDYAFLR